MSEPLIALAIGFLLAVLLAFGAGLLFRRRTRRESVLRLPAMPQPIMTVIEADMDQLHSQIAVATRRLEICVEQMKAKTTSQLSQLGKTSESVGRLRAEMTERTSAIAMLQDKEKTLAAHLRSTEAELDAKGRSLTELELDLAERKAELVKIRASIDFHPELRAAGQRHAAEVAGLKGEKAALETALAQSRAECAKLNADIETMRKQVETTWATERMANAVLRERINDVASEVVRVAVALEGLNSPIDSLVDGQSADIVAPAPESAATPGNGSHPAAAPLDGAEGATSELVHRIRALRQRSARLAAPTEERRGLP
jgi:septal ring factor EnvC (AmiA/AmiB activator)